MLQFCLKPRRGSNFNNISFSRVLFSCPNLHELSFIILIEHLDFSSPCSQFEILLVFLSLGCPPPSKKLPEDTGGFFVDIFGGGAALGRHCWARAFSSCGEGGLLFLAVHGLLIVVASVVAEHGL